VNHLRRTIRAASAGICLCAGVCLPGAGALASPPSHEVIVTEGKPHGSLRPIAIQAAACPGSELKPEPENLGSIRIATLCLVNQERALHGERALTANGKLEQAAQRHTDEMVAEDYFEHVGPHGDTPLSRIAASGYIYSSRVGFQIGENIACGTRQLATPNAIVKGWIASPSHLANILNSQFRDTAIGVATKVPSSLSEGQAGATYTQDFGVIIAG
jgi:uncharacterized protein YkwD